MNVFNLLSTKALRPLLTVALTIITLGAWAQALPTVTSHPNDQTICETKTATFSITGNNINTYHWEINDGSGWTRLTNTAPYSGTNTATLTITNVTPSLNGNQYRCFIFNAHAQYTTSNAADLTVYNNPTISNQPSSINTCLNNNTSFSITATGTNITYQWQVNDGNGWSNLSNTGVYSNVTTNTLNLTGVTATMNNYKYRCVVSGTCTPAAISNEAILTVVLPVTVTTNPTDVTICEDATTTFTINGNNINTYHWEVNDGSGWVRISNAAPYSGANTATLTISNASTSLNGNQYRCFVFNACAQYTTSSAADLTVNAKPDITNQPSNSTICLNNNTSFSITATGTNITYQWQVDDGSGWADLSNTGLYSNVTTNTLDITGATATIDGYDYRCVVSGTCTPSATSNSATINVDMPPSITTQPSDKTTCENGTTSFSVAATGTSLSYQWQVDNGSGFSNVTNNTTYSGATTNKLDINANSNLNNYSYQCIVTGKCTPSTMSNIATLSIDMLPVITSQPVDVSICEGANTTFGVIATGTNVAYQWQVDDGTGWTDLSNNTIYDGVKTELLKLTTPPTSYNAYKYRCIVSGKCSPSETSIEANLEIMLTTDILTHISADTFCEGKLSTIPLNTNGANLQYQWQINDGTGYKDITAGATFDGEKTDILIFKDPAKIHHGQTIRCIATGTCKSDTTENILANIYNKPEVVTPPNNVSVIQGQNASFSVVATGTALTYQWQASTGGAYSNLNDNSIYNGVHTNKLTITAATEAQDGFTYRCVVIGIPNCGFVSDVTSPAILNVTPPLSIGNTSMNNSTVTLYPNPVTGSTVTLSSTLKQDVSYTIVDQMGKVVLNGEMNSNQKTTNINVSDIASGVYIILFNNDSNVKPIRFTKL